MKIVRTFIYLVLSNSCWIFYFIDESIEINENGDDVENDRNTQIDNLFENTEYQDEAEEERISIFGEEISFAFFSFQ